MKKETVSSGITTDKSNNEIQELLLLKINLEAKLEAVKRRLRELVR
jgi:hypothetical protein